MRLRGGWIGWMFSLFLFLHAGASFGAPPFKATPPRDLGFSSFGHSVALSRDGLVALVGSGCEGISNCDAGKAYLYASSRKGWGLVQILAPASAHSGSDRFAWSVALSGDGRTAALGNPGRQGSVSVYSQQSGIWIEEARLFPPDSQDYDGFGISVALSQDGGTLLVGAYAHSCPGVSYCGTAYAFVHESGGWRQQGELLALDPHDSSTLGFSVALSADGDTAFLGAPGDRSVYEFGRSGDLWSQAFKFSEPAPVGSDHFGESVALSEDGTTALVGVPDALCPTVLQSCGAAYFLRRSAAGWTVREKVVSPTVMPGGLFGVAVALSGDGQAALVGADCTECITGTHEGTVTLFRGSAAKGWRPAGKLSQPASPVHFGHATALSGDGKTAAAGAPTDGGPGCPTCGAAYLYSPLTAAPREHL